MADIFDEVNEDLRADRAQAFLRRYGPLILVGAGLAVAATGGWEAWRWWQGKRDAGIATEFLAAMRIADQPGPAQAVHRPEAIAAFQTIAGRAPEGYRTLARLRAAALQADAGDLAGAAATWDQVAADGSADPLLRDLANLLWVQRQLDSADPGVLEARLKPLLAADNPLHFLASESQAVLLMREGKIGESRDTLRVLASDQAAPEGVRARAAALLDRLGG